MKTGKTVMGIGFGMFTIGLAMYYSITLGHIDPVLRIIKNTGTFVGIAGIGVILAGILLYLIARNEPPIAEEFDI